MYYTKDYLLDYEIIVSPERAKRPTTFKEEISQKDLREEIKKCPFCPGNEDKTPNEYWRIEKKGQWIIRCFPNKYKIWKWHDLIVDTPDHLKDWPENENLDLTLSAIQKRVKELEEIEEVKVVQVFRNYGKFAGASLKHSHIQILALDFVPKKIEELSGKMNKCSCRICRGKWKKEKLIKEGKFFRLLAVDGRFPYEVEIHLKEHKKFQELKDEELKELAEFLKFVIKKIKTITDSYNVLFFNGIKGKYFHFFIRIIPRTEARFGGFEFSDNVFVNSVGKDKAFEFYTE